jgi:hypothetical protein
VGVIVDAALPAGGAVPGVEPGGATADWSGVEVAPAAGVEEMAADGAAASAAGVPVMETAAAGADFVAVPLLLAELPVAKPKVITTRPAASSG